MQKWFFRTVITAIIFCLAVGGASGATEMVTNGDFSQDGYGWTEQLSPGSSGSASIEYGQTSSQTRAAYLVGTNGPDYIYASLSQSVDLSYVETLTFSLMDIGVASGSGWGDFIVRIDDSTDLFSTDINNLPTNKWGDYSVDVSSYNGVHKLTFMVYFSVVSSASNNFVVGLTDVSALNQATGPTYVSDSLSATTLSVGNSLTASITVRGGIPNTSFDIDWGDGQTSSENVATQGVFTNTISHTYTTPGTYTVTGSIYTPLISEPIEFTMGVVNVVALDFTAYPTSGDPPLSVQFSLSAQNINSVLWDFGDGTTSTVENPVHTYAASATPYTVTLTGYTAGGDSIPVVKTDYILASPQTLLWGATSYEAGETAALTWQLRDPDFTNYQYTLQILASDSQGNTAGTSIITPVEITSASDSYSWDTTGTSGYYTAAIYRSGTTSPIVFATTNIVTQATLTVNLAINGVTYTNATTVSVTQSGTIISTQTTTTGQAQFTIPTGAYIVSATTTGYATQTATVNLLESTAVTIDFVTGTTDSPFPSGYGSYYASTFATFRVVDKTYGTELEGATITGYAVEATNLLEWLANIYGQAWGGKIIGSEVRGITDSEGLCSFAMFTNVRYTLTLTHPDLPEPATRTFALTSLSTEYPWYVDIPHEKDPTAQSSVVTSASVSSEGLINITYTDNSKTTSLVTVEVYEKDDENNYTILMDSTTSLGNSQTIQLQLTDFSGADIKIILTATTSAFGTVERTYYHTFPGPWFDLGLPSSLYIWICLFTAILLGGISPFLNSYACCFVICFFEWLYWAFGWFFEIGQATAALLLTVATVLSIAYYIASRR